MAKSAERTDPKLWDEVKAEVTHGDKGGEPDQWSARKAQLAVSEYKKRGGGYRGRKSADNHLVQWTNEEWDTKSGKPSGETHERYLPRAARQKLTDAEYRRTTAKKRADTAAGRQFSRQPEDVARKVAPTRSTGRKDAASQGKATGLAPGRSPASSRGAALARGEPARDVPKRKGAASKHEMGASPKKPAARGSSRASGTSKTSLLAEARKRDIPGRSRMSREQLEAALNA